jgi:hypothetical protein
MNMLQAAKNQQTGKWGTPTVAGLNYQQQAKKLSKDFLDKEVIYFEKGNLAIPTSGFCATQGSRQSHFVTETDQEVIFQYNPSYSFELAVTELAPLDPRWLQVRATQNRLNAMIFEKHGLLDWCIVKVNKKTGAITLGEERELSKIAGHESGQGYAPRIEWPRYLMGHMLNYFQHQDKGSKQALDVFKAKYGTNLTGLSYAGYRNELVIAMSTMMKMIYQELTPDDVAFFKQEVFGANSYFGSKDYNSLQNTFQQLLIGMMVQALRKSI